MNEETITNLIETDKYLALYILVSNANGNPTREQLHEIVSVVLENFKEEINY